MLGLGYQAVQPAPVGRAEHGTWRESSWGRLSSQPQFPHQKSAPERWGSCLLVVASALGDKGRKELDFTGKINLEFITGIP